MKNGFFKVFGTMGLALLIAHAGVAWAFAECLKDGDNTARAESFGEILAGESPSQNVNSRPHGPSRVKIHCLPAYHEISAVGQASSESSLTQVRKASDLKKLLLAGDPTSTKEIEALRRSFYFGWANSASLSEYLPRHLLLSVFLI